MSKDITPATQTNKDLLVFQEVFVVGAWIVTYLLLAAAAGASATGDPWLPIRWITCCLSAHSLALQISLGVVRVQP